MQTVLLGVSDSCAAETRAVLLSMEGFRVRQCAAGTEVRETARRDHPDLVVLDALPEIDGPSLCRILRAESAVPIMVLAPHADDMQHIGALELGADDYLVEPLSTGVFLARVRALLRRSRYGAMTAQREVMRQGASVVDVSARRVWRSGTEVRLNKKEFDLLTYLMGHAGAVVPRTELLQHGWGHTRNVKSLDVYMFQLRQKLERDPARPEYLLTVQHQGYHFHVPPQDALQDS